MNMLSMWTQRPRFLTIALLAGLVLAGRMALATHGYEHNMGEAVHECAVCEFGHISKDDLVAIAEAPQLAVVHENRRLAAVAVAIFPPSGPYLARAPPSRFV